MGSLRGDKTGKMIEKRSKINFFDRFSHFVAPRVSPKYSYAPELVCQRLSDEFEKKIEQNHVKIERER